MRSEPDFQGDQLASALRFLGIHFLAGENEVPESIHRHPWKLIKALALSSEARLRLSLIPLFLDHPDFSKYVPKISRQLDPQAKITLQCYYTAAMLIQMKYDQDQGTVVLPDFFSQELGIEKISGPVQGLKLLALRHQILSATRVNWLGTYHHAEQIWLRELGIQKS